MKSIVGGAMARVVGAGSGYRILRIGGVLRSSGASYVAEYPRSCGNLSRKPDES
jgi:hypothetical protein